MTDRPTNQQTDRTDYKVARTQPKDKPISKFQILGDFQSKIINGKPTTGQAKAAKAIINKNELFFIFQPQTAFSEMSTLILNDTELNFSFTFTEPINFFSTPNKTLKLKLKIKNVVLCPQLVLLKENLLKSINHRLSTKNIQIPYQTYVHKIFTIEIGR